MNGTVTVNPPPEEPLPAEAQLILIGTTMGEQRFVELFDSARS